MKLLVCLLISGCLLNAEEMKPRPSWRTILYRSSIVALTAANAIDIGSSWGGQEKTPFLRSTDRWFGARGTGAKLGMLAGIVSTEMWMTHKHRDADMIATTVNLSLAAAMTKISMNNIAIKTAGNK
jgi:hypothetical protein